MLLSDRRPSLAGFSTFKNSVSLTHTYHFEVSKCCVFFTLRLPGGKEIFLHFIICILKAAGNSEIQKKLLTSQQDPFQVNSRFVNDRSYIVLE